MEEVITAKPNTNRFVAFLRRNWALFFAPLIVGALYIYALCFYEVYPFGNKYTAASYDLSAQIAPFIEHLFDVFDGKSTLTFSYAIVGGADVTGTFLYFFVSPFSFLFLIFGDGKTAHASSIVMLCKLMTIAFSGTWFAKKLFRGIPDYLCAAIGVVYAYCGYTFVASTYINWVDFLIYVPFAVGAFRRFVQTGKFLRFSILVACCIYTCFSIACFSLFIVFPTLVIYGLLCVEKERRSNFIAYLVVAFFVAIALALPVLFPAFGATAVSGRGGGLFENLWKGFAQNSATGELGSFNSSTYMDSYSQSLYRKWSYIVSDSVFVILTLIWFYRKGFKDKFAQFMLVAGILTLLPLLVDESMNLLNMGSYMSYALRFGFLNAAYFLGGACLCLESLCYKPFAAYDGSSLLAKLPEREDGETPPKSLEEEKEGGRYALKKVFRKENKGVFIWSTVLTVLCVGIFAFLFWFISEDNYRVALKWFNSKTSNFSSSFAHSLGGMEVVVVPFIAVVVAAVLCGFFVGGKKVSVRLVSVLLVCIVGLQVFFYNGHLVLGNTSTQHVRMSSYQILNEELNRREDGYFRVKDYNDKLTACAPFTGNSNSFSVFSSVIDADNFVAFQLFGYKGNGKNSFKSAHNRDKKNRSDEFGDSFLGYKYFISTQFSIEKDYVKPVPKLDENGEPVLTKDGKPVQLRHGDLYVYENTIVFPLGYRVQREGFTFAVPNVNNSTNRRKNQEALYEYLRGKELVGSYVTPSIATELSSYLHGRAADVTVSAGKITAKVTAEAGESLLLNFVAVKGYEVTVNGKKASLIENDLKFLQVALEEGENEVTFSYSSPYVGYAALGVGAGIVMLLAVAFVVKRTKWVEKCAPVLKWAGVSVSAAIIGFFMLYPTGVFLIKVVEMLKGWLL